MKYGQLLIGLIVGAMLCFGLTTYLGGTKQQKSKTPSTMTDSSSSSENWLWPDSLDALKAAPDHHKVVYEDDNIRILAVILDGKSSEPVHTHKWKSIMWIAKPIVPCQINNYVRDKNDNLIKSDSILVKEMPVNIGQFVNPEGPTSITNLGAENGVAYRVEFKKDFKS